ncbi:hypothetical protein [Cytobacillus purgationiresistens]|uniref:Nucleoside-diphosphate-sugar epimerase n=1 Tax=Cytobacillus purgationiresistens TaxID=863449 RepID=A0ABU0ABX2_9BACI|nr:hypothetical protein [Cytobacillus purgationiresistens]MDQ0268753.1 nucleoside-diphosphate-sugar epimerase [Cytobacillus purgationiresistens]
MDRAVIIGSFSFVGFHFCKYLLDQGYQIIGITTLEDPFHEDKRLEIGRNANFYEKEAIIQLEKETLIIADLYGLFLQNAEAIEKGIERFQQLEDNQEELKSIFILPAQWLEEDHKYKQMIKPIEKEMEKGYSYYLPTVYGPYQPDSLLFQQVFLNQLQKNERLTIKEQEWCADAMYVEDVVKAMHSSVQTDQAGEWLLKSTVENHWELCAEYLELNKDIFKNNLEKTGQEEREIAERDVQDQFGVEVGLENQKKHLSFLLNR